MAMKEVTIRAAAPQIFRRPLIYVSAQDAMIHAATFLAIGPQIYVDGLVVLDTGRLVGRIGGWQLANHMLEKKEKWLDGRADDIAEPLEQALDADAPLKNALSIFSETRFAFMPVSSGANVVASLSIRDLLGAVERDRKVGQLASPLTTVSEQTSVADALEFMVKKGVRNLVALKNDGPYMINDRRVLEFLLGHESRQLVAEKGFSGLNDVALSRIGFYKGRTIAPDETAGAAANMLSEVGTPCLFAGDKILTPWDLVMK